MRTSADHTILEQSTKVSPLGITGSYLHVNCALSRKEEINGLATGLTMQILELPAIPGVQCIVLAGIRLLIVSRTFPDKCKA